MKVAIFGAGNMGLAFANAFVQKDLIPSSEILLIEPRQEAHEALAKQGFIHIVERLDERLALCDLLVFAVKPQDFSTLALELSPFVSSRQIALSIMAGVKIEKIRRSLNAVKIVRCMPNAPAKIGLGVTGYTSENLTIEDQRWIQALLDSTGSAIQFSDEQLLDAVTAMSGSGPAYFYYFLNAMVEAGEKMGIEHRLAKDLACETMLGAYHLVRNSEVSFAELINAVKSKGGTTEAALVTFEEGKVGATITQGVLNAEKRAKELSNLV